MREELAPYNVRLTLIAPGMTETPIFSLMSSLLQFFFFLEFIFKVRMLNRKFKI